MRKPPRHRTPPETIAWIVARAQAGVAPSVEARRLLPLAKAAGHAVDTTIIARAIQTHRTQLTKTPTTPGTPLVVPDVSSNGLVSRLNALIVELQNICDQTEAMERDHVTVRSRLAVIKNTLDI